jgi:hypothetical protein
LIVTAELVPAIDRYLIAIVVKIAIRFVLVIVALRGVFAVAILDGEGVHV